MDGFAFTPDDGTAIDVIAYRTIDKAGWGDGPWQEEPDKVQWRDSATGLPCLIVRGPIGALCGYVGVDKKHPWHGIEYSSPADGSEEGEDYNWETPTPESLISVHGGLTFSNACQHGPDESTGICHKPAPGEPDDVWWFGFDCAHSGDLCPDMAGGYWRSQGYEYRTLGYVRRQCASLAKQLVEAGLEAAQKPAHV